MNIEQQAELLDRISTLRKVISNESSQISNSHQQILSALSQFSECVRYLNTRRSGTEISLEDEASVQDAIFLMLRPWVHDLVPESPTEKVANRYTIKDFTSKSARTVIETKLIRNEAHGKDITKELYDDIENYRHNPDCDHLIFFIYDPNSYIPDVNALRLVIEEKRQYGGGRNLCCYLSIP
jgi:hypothetical protein